MKKQPTSVTGYRPKPPKILKMELKEVQPQDSQTDEKKSPPRTGD